MDDLQVIGKSISKVDGLEKVTGAAIFATDLKLAGMLHGKVLRSPLPHARIVNIDTRQAKRVPGVRAVVTGEDLKALYGRSIQDQPFFCFEKVRYVGDVVAGVAAADEDTAAEALSLIRVEYEELPAVFDPLLAMEAGAPVIHENLKEYWCASGLFPVPGSNICNRFKLRRGDLEQGFREADIISESTFSSQMAQHCHLEPHAAIVQVDASGRVFIWSNTQTPYAVRAELAKSLGLPVNRIRVIIPHIGGAFGGKSGPKVEPLCYALAAEVKNHRPVRVVLTREEEFSATSVVRHPSVITVRSGVRKSGTLTGHEIRIVFDTGAYADSGPVVLRSAGMAASGPYYVPNIRVDGYCVYTNKIVAGAFRGFGIPQVMWAIESQMDILAEKIGMDPVEFRLKNALDEGSLSITGQKLKSVGVKECIRRAARAIGWNEGGRIRGRGKGVAAMHKSTQTPTSSTAFVKLNEDGTADVLASTVDMGQGSKTVFAQIAAEELGLNVKDVRVINPDTDVTPYDHFTGSSRSTFHMGNAVKAAAADAKLQLLENAAPLLQASPSDLEARQGLISVKGFPDRKIAVKQVPMGAGGHFAKGNPIIGRGAYTVQSGTSIDPETGQGSNPSVFWMYGAQAAEVEVDEETGAVTVLKVSAAHDAGKGINPLNCEQQIEGAIGMGVSLTVLEELKVKDGKIANTNFADYKIATSLDMPEMVPIIVESPHDEGPYGAKGIGEPALAAIGPAIANAIYDAVGIRIRDLPITPEKVLQALWEKKNEVSLKSRSNGEAEENR